MAELLISNVSDTARWVAVYRARESRRRDALFQDPLADRLAGNLGHAIAGAAKGMGSNGWPMVTRTKLLDDLILKVVREGCDLVLNLAAGLDTRPYRLPLPSALSWIEVDLPALVEEKERLLAGEKPVCVLSREKVDLVDPAARAALFNRVLAQAQRALVITEGLLVYLEPDQVRAIGRDLAARPAVRTWLLDITSEAISRMLHKRMGDQLANSPFKFAPAEGVGFIEALGFQAREIESLFVNAARLRRLPLWMRPFALLPDANPRGPGKRPWSAVVRFEPA